MATLATLGQAVMQPQQPPSSVGDQQAMSEQFEEGKIFVGGLPSATTKENLKAYFAQYGEVKEAQVMIDPSTNKSRGFGFVTFDEANAVATVKAVLENKPHTIDGKIVDAKPAVQKGIDVANTGLLIHATKIFVGGVPQGTTKDDITEYFSKFGKVTEVEFKYDRNTQRMRGFGFVAFEKDDSAKKAAETSFHSINGKTVEVKRAEPRGRTPSGMGRGYPPPYAQPQQGVYGDFSHPQQYNYRNNGMGGYGPGYSAYPPPPPPPSYQYSGYPPGYTQQYNAQDYNGYSYGRGQSAYGQENGYSHRSSYNTATADAYSGGAAYSSYPEQNNQYAAYNDPTPAANYGRGTSQQRFTTTYNTR